MFHAHDWQLVAKTYAPPTPIRSIGGIDAESDSFQRMIHGGCTTFVWKCALPSCSSVMTTVTLGKEVAK